MLTLSEQITNARAAFAEAPDERARMGRISGVLWMCAATIGVIDLFLPGSGHASTPLVVAVGAVIFLYGLASVTGWIPWERASMNALALGTVLREAAAAGKRPAHHLAHLIVHGALHLAGHDHHHPGDARRMERLETKLLHRLRDGTVASPRVAEGC